MLIVISDLHLTDGTSGSTISPGAFQILGQELRDVAIAASWRGDGRYRPVDRIDLVLLGDGLDVIRSARWLAGTVRPWDDPQRPEMVEIVAQITADILTHNEASLSVLRRLATPGQLSVPAADRLGRPADSAAQNVRLLTHYLVGNHDWFYHLPGRMYDPVRQAIVRQMGLANPDQTPFAHDPSEDSLLIEMLRRHRVLARHGDIFDPLNFEGNRNASSLGDAIVIELVSRFAIAAQRELGDELPPATLQGLRELDNVRPLLMVPVWLNGLLERTCPLPHTRSRVKAVWDELVERFLALPMVRQRKGRGPHNLVDGLADILAFSKRVPIGWASKIVTWLQQISGQQDDSYCSHALGEPEFRSRRAKYVVYGHTHYAECVPLEASHADGHALNQVYFNSGTWRRTLRRAVSAPQQHEFVPADVMTYLVFYQGDERGGRPYETWTGTLGIAPAEVPEMRLDVPASPRATTGPIPGHSPAPHFAGRTVAPRIIPRRRS